MAETPETAPPRPNFFIAGVPKAGTTSLYEYLRQHPQVFMPGQSKEPSYFIHDYGVEKWEDYLSLFKNAGDKKAIGESSTLYCYCAESAPWIKTTLGDVRIIILLRHPAKRALSLYGWMVREGYEDAPTFAEALEREPARLQDPAFRKQCPQFFPDYLYFTTGFYFEQVSRFMEIFGRDRVKVYLFEEFIKKPVALCQDVFRFLEIDPNFTPRLEVHNEGRIPRSIALQYWLSTAAPRQLRLLPPKLRRSVIKRLRKWNIRLGGKPQADRELLQALMIRYRPDIERLEKLLGRDLSIWK